MHFIRFTLLFTMLFTSEFSMSTSSAASQELLRAIRGRGLGRYLPSAEEKRHCCHVDTIDGYQGMEQGLVLFSATRSNDSNALGLLGLILTLKVYVLCIC